MSDVKLSAPVGLGGSGKSLWSQITMSYDLRPDELVVLEDACRTSDMLAALEQAWAEDGSPMTTKGSMGQLVIHPLIAAILAHRTSRAAFLGRLKLPDDDAAPAANQHRAAATTRWHERGA